MRKDFTAIEYNAFFNHQKQLSNEEEKDVIQKTIKGDKKAREKLILSNLKFAAYEANRVKFMAMDFDDLYNECVEGLIIATDHLKSNFNNKFVTYAGFWIKANINVANNKSGYHFKLPDLKYKNVHKVRAIFGKYMDDNKYTYDEVIKIVASEVGISEDEVKELLELSRTAVSLDGFVSGKDKTEMPQDVFLKDDKSNFEEDIIKSELQKGIYDIVKRLPKKEADVLIKHFGLNGTTPMSYSEIAKSYGCSKAWANFIEKKACKRLLSDYGAELEQYIA